MRLVNLQGVSIYYGDYCAIHNANLEIHQGDFLGIIGPNGGGKTSLIRAMLGAVDYKGEIEFCDEIQRHGGVGYMPQISNIDKSFPISIEEVVLSGLQSQRGFRTRYSTADRERALELLSQTGIADVAKSSVDSVSGGQLQRAMLCRAIISEPKLLILDEPTNFVDNRFENELYRILRELNERMAIVMISHDVGTITSVVKEIVCVNRHVHHHRSNHITQEQLIAYDCPLQIIAHGAVPHTVLGSHAECGCKECK